MAEDLSNKEREKRLDLLKQEVDLMLTENDLMTKTAYLAAQLADLEGKQLTNKKIRNELESKIYSAQKEISKNSIEIEKLEAKKLGLTKKQQNVLDKQIGALKLQNIENKQIINNAGEALDLYDKQTTALSKIQNSLSSLTKTSKMFSFSYIIDQALNLDKQIVGFEKSLLLSRGEAEKLRENFSSYANSTGDTFITTNKLIAANKALNDELGFAKVFSGEINEQFVNLTKRVGLTEKGATGFARASILTGKSMRSISADAAGLVSSVSSQYGIQLNIKDVMEEAGSASAIMLANFKGSVPALTEGVAQMKALGTSLDQTDKQAESLLNFESSIESQLSAQLLTGRQINLNKARELALSNDLGGLAKELVNQQMSFNEFQNLNRIQQEQFAKSLGISRDILADQLLKIAVRDKSQSEIVALYGEEALKRSESLTAQDRINAAMEKATDIFVKFAEGPLEKVLNMISSLAEHAGVVKTIFATIIGMQFTNFINNILNIVTALRKGAIAATFLKGILTPQGLLFSAAATLGIIALINSATADDLMSNYGKRTLITPKGAYALNNNDTVIAGTNLFKGNDVYSGPEGSISLGGGDVVKAINDLGNRIDKIAERPVYTKPSEFTPYITQRQFQEMRQSV